jgi:hypothetical protein
MKPVPEIGKRYNCFDDGKISHSRLYTVDVVDIIPFNKIDKKTLKNWKKEVKNCDWLFAKETDYFVKTANGEDGNAIFVRTLNGGWFSIGQFMNSGRLDVDGSLSTILNAPSTLGICDVRPQQT